VTEDAVDTFRTEEASAGPKTGRDACLINIYPTGPLMGTRYPLTDESFIGRTDDCDVRNPDGSVSRLHAKVVRGNDGLFRVNDLGSTNGTFVNNARKQSAVLSDGDYLRIGNCIYRFLAGGNLEAEYHEEIHRLTIIDALTGVHNRRSLNEILERELARADRHHRPLAVILLDIDRFKSINDRFGHVAGDLTLRDLSARIKDVVRRDELLARYGGEEFALVLPESGAEEAVELAERIRKVTEAVPFHFNDTPYPVTVSLGVGVTPGGEAITPSALIERADKNLYTAKQTGRNRVVS
jgi:two-component system cell cycle response regulator